MADDDNITPVEDALFVDAAGRLVKELVAVMAAGDADAVIDRVEPLSADDARAALVVAVGAIAHIVETLTQP